MPTSKVVKRTGDIVTFDSSRIERAVARAVQATGEEIDEGALTALTDRIIEEIDTRFVDFYPNVENIQDVVEKHLMRGGMFETAKAYILYRAQHQQDRESTRERTVDAARRGLLTVTTREGRAALFNVRKLEESVALAAKGLDNLSLDDVVEEAVKGTYDGMPTVQVERALVMSAASSIERDPIYSYLAARLQLQALFREVTSESPTSPIRDDLYRSAFVLGIRNGVTAGIFDERLQDLDLNRLASALQPVRDELFQYLGVQTLADRYLAREGNHLLELPQAFWMRVAMGLALDEQDREGRAIEFYEMLSRLLYVASTPTLFHSGTSHPQLSSCFLTTVGDDLGDIFKSLSDNAQLSKWSGGLGNDWTNVRGTGSPIHSTNVESQGVVPFLKIANDVTMAINRSGKRRGATCAYLEMWHYDVEDFCDLRRNTGDERRRTHDMDTALWIPDLFMKRLENNGEWTLFSPDEVPELHHLYGSAFERRYEEYEQKAARGEMRLVKRLPAHQLWRRALTMLFETGHPWITFKDPSNVRSPQDHAGVVHSSNLCTEITLNTSAEETAVCNLGSVNLARHITNGELDTELLGRTVEVAMRMLDNVIDLNFYPTVEAKNSNMRHRPVGLGLMGLQDALFQLDLAFESQGALEFSDRVMEQISYHAILGSSRLAAERGSYESYRGSKWDRGLFPYDTVALLEEERGLPIEVGRERRLDWTPVYEHVKAHGMRNSNTMAIAPTATISNIAGCFPCFEPIYNNLYVKANLSGEFTVVNGYLIEDLKRLGLWDQRMLERLKYHNGSVQAITEIPDDIRAKYKEVFELDVIAMLRLTAARAKWVDQSQSHNVFLRGTSGRQLDDTYRAAWRMGLKTTYYLRSLAASQIEKSTLGTDYGLTQKRAQEETAPVVIQGQPLPQPAPVPVAAGGVAACRIDDPDCEACQ
ncbi:MAG TPA: ribonucleoside-diphosphate reductase subunit alpha [Candidatus Dormibacteraeota bacterium]|jgi:ribonucleoside-diphosphate reductase alpha chain|nr:ribonucleoside-diphosphate reductase subunit alpha [Candidatus Dormibacteraeota bacterium]